LLLEHRRESADASGLGAAASAYLGEINDRPRAAWTKVTEVFDPVGQQTQELAL
jgi:hypothetical protein